MKNLKVIPERVIWKDTETSVLQHHNKCYNLNWIYVMRIISTMILCAMWIPCYVYWFIKERGKNVMNKNMRKMYTEEEIGKIASQSGGTKLYKHVLSDQNYRFELITTHKNPLDFTILNTYGKLNEFLKTLIIFKFKDPSDNSDIYWDDNSGMFAYTSQYLLQDNTVVISLVDIDDWYLSSTTDTVTEL